MTSNYVIVSIKLFLDIRNKEYMHYSLSGFDINNHHHHKTSSITITANYYHCYCCCWCCWGCDDTYYWVYLSSDNAFQVNYKVQQVFLQSATAYFITKGDGLLFQSATAFFYKVRQVFLQSATGITKCDNFISTCDRYYEVRQNSPSSETQGQLVRTTECSWWKITVRSRQAVNKMNIPSSRLAAPGSPRMVLPLQ